MKKTPQMKYLELKHGVPIDEMLAKMLSNKGPKKTAENLGVSPVTLYRWAKLLGLKIEKVIIQEREA